jgi:precorrin-2/cobalt-factor-2 C20-methyltransferase
MTGRIYGVGLGPGDPELLTLKALRLLRAVPVVAYPAPDEGASFARAIVAQWLSPAQREIVIRVPMAPERGPAEATYDRAAAAIADAAGAGQDVAVLCQGDPFFYGSFINLFARLAPRFPVEVVPGVSSLTACAAAAAFPLVAHDEVLTIVPAPLAETELERRLAQTDAAAIIKLGRHLPKVRRVLERLGRAAAARYVERATLTSQRILDLAEAAAGTAPYFSMILLHRGVPPGDPP